MTVAQFAAALVLGVLSILLPILLFISLVATCVCVARWWIDRRS